MTYTVDAVGIVKSFGDHLALDRVDLAIEDGSVVALLGPNGAGKTTMVRILATLIRPDAGIATVAGYDVRADPIGVRRSISLTGQFAAVDDVLTGRENLEMMAQLWHLPRARARARAGELLAVFDLVEASERRASTYSGGMRRRLDLAIAMIERPQLLFLDEPTTGLDPRSRELLWDTVRRLVDEGVTILLTTQYLEEADQLADTIAMLDRGRIVAQGSADELKSSLGAEVIRLQFADTTTYERAAGCLELSLADPQLRILEVPTDATAAHVHATLGRLATVGASAQKVSFHRPSLDDVFLSLTGSQSTRFESKEVA
jgi:ABC-2 type transport system ATP-binding protein